MIDEYLVDRGWKKKICSKCSKTTYSKGRLLIVDRVRDRYLEAVNGRKYRIPKTLVSVEKWLKEQRYGQ